MQSFFLFSLEIWSIINCNNNHKQCLGHSFSLTALFKSLGQRAGKATHFGPNPLQLSSTDAAVPIGHVLCHVVVVGSHGDLFRASVARKLVWVELLYFCNFNQSYPFSSLVVICRKCERSLLANWLGGSSLLLLWINMTCSLYISINLCLLTWQWASLGSMGFFWRKYVWPNSSLIICIEKE